MDQAIRGQPPEKLALLVNLQFGQYELELFQHAAALADPTNSNEPDLKL